MAKDFRNKKFQKVLRGYADAEVDTYIAYINEEYHKLERAKNDSERKLALALQKIDAMNSTIEEQSRDLTELTGIVPERAAAMKQAEDERKRQAEEAEQNRAEAKNLLKEAEERLAQAEQIRQEAVESAEQILNAAHAEADAAKAEEEKALRTAKFLYGEVCSFRDSLFEIYNTHIESVEGIAAKAEDFLGLTDADPAETEETEIEADDGSEEDFEDLPEDEEPEETEEYADEADDSDESEEFETTEESDEPDEPAEPEEPVEAEAPEENEPAEDDGPALFEPDMSLFTPEPKRTESGDLFIDLEDGEGFTELTDEEESPEAEDEAPEYAEEPSESQEEEPEFSDDEPESAESAEAEEPELEPAEPETSETAAAEAADAAESGDFQSEEEEDASQSYTISELLRKNRGGAERKKSEYADLDDLLSKGNGSASDDEFNRVYGGDSSKRVDEIRRQPTVTPEEPKNPKKHKKF